MSSWRRLTRAVRISRTQSAMNIAVSNWHDRLGCKSRALGFRGRFMSCAHQRAASLSVKMCSVALVHSQHQHWAISIWISRTTNSTLTKRVVARCRKSSSSGMWLAQMRYRVALATTFRRLLSTQTTKRVHSAASSHIWRGCFQFRSSRWTTKKQTQLRNHGQQFSISAKQSQPPSDVSHCDTASAWIY